MSLIVFGIDFKTASLPERERFHFAEDKLPQAYDLAKEMDFAPVIVSTCNRVEIYLWSFLKPKDEKKELKKLKDFIMRYHGFAKINFDKMFYKEIGPTALLHLFESACGLASLIVGENQILHQLKDAYRIAGAHVSLPTEMARAFEFAFACGKEVRTKTNIGKGGMSLGSVTIDLLKEVYDKNDEITIALLGAGEVAEEVLSSLTHYEKAKIIVLNRTKKNADRLMKKFSHRKVYFEPIEKLYEVIDKSNLVITSAVSSDFLIRKDQLLKKRPHMKFLFFLDLGVPRNIDPSVGELKDVVLYTIDGLKRIVEKNAKLRVMEFDKAKMIVGQKLNEWDQWRQRRIFFQTMEQMSDRLVDMKKDVALKYFKKHFSHARDKKNDNSQMSFDVEKMRKLMDRYLKSLTDENQKK